MDAKSVPLRRRVRRLIGNTWLRAFGWHVEGGVPDVRKAVVVAAPHTSNWDFPFTLAVAFALDVEVSWLGKHTLFEGVHGPFFKWLGGIAVDRRSRHNLVSQVVDVLNSRDDLMLIVPPEGTRALASRWKTGFYYIATGAEVPIILGFLDFEKKCGGLGHVFRPTGDIAADMAAIRDFYKDVKGKHPERTGTITLGDDAPQSDAPALDPVSARAA
jgi:hypothetical protein